MRANRSTVFQTKLGVIGLVATLASLTVACRGDEFDPLPSPPTAVPTGTVSVSTTPATPPSAPPSGSPSGSPGAAGNLTAGTASLTTTGGLNATATYDTLFTPGIWTLPPGAIDLSWRGNGRQALSIRGPSFTAQLPTDVDRVLEFTVPGPDGPLTFRSSGGECLVTISPAFADQIGGSFTCVSVASEDGAVTVSAQGSFSAQATSGAE
ncbi:MAG TPA: hypothetical protein VI341_09395 [Actinomycetota bacterium]